MRFTPHNDDRDSVVGRALIILEVFAKGGGKEMRLSAIASYADLPKATTYRLVQVLLARRFLDRTGPYYRPGLRLFELGSMTATRRKLCDLAMPFMADLYEATHETVHLAVRDGLELMYVEKIRGHRIGSVPTAAGSKMPLYCTALGKTLLAGEPDSVMEETIERGLRPLTSHTLTTGTHLRRDVDSARIDGVAFDREESVPGLTCVSAPILGLDNRVAAALSVSTNIRRLPRVESLAPLVTVAARGISELLGASRRTAGVPVRVP